ncbi:MAG: hypothetical protein ACLP0J_20475 [Solirubrobacteraceae bacterium]|jgi:hypothetical protein
MDPLNNPILPIGSGIQAVTSALAPQRVSAEERQRQQGERERKRQQRENATPSERRSGGTDGARPRIDISA